MAARVFPTVSPQIIDIVALPRDNAKPSGPARIAHGP